MEIDVNISINNMSLKLGRENGTGAKRLGIACMYVATNEIAEGDEK